MNIFINLIRSSVPPLFILFTKTQKRKNQTRVCPPIFQLPLITSPRYPYPQCPKPPFIMSHFTIWGIPFCHLGCPISPFGMSHFTFWGIPFYHLGCPILPFGVYFRHICAQCTARFSVCHLRFRCKICAFSLSIGKIDLAPFCIFVILHFCDFDDVPSSKELTLGLPQINLGILSLNRSFVILLFCIFVFLCFCILQMRNCFRSAIETSFIALTYSHF